MAKRSYGLLTIGQMDQPLDHRFTRGPELSFWTLAFLLAGRVRVRTPQGEHLRVGPSISLTPPHCPYSMSWGGGEGPWSEIWVIFDPLPHWGPLLDWPRSLGPIGELNPAGTPQTPKIEHILLEAMRDLRSSRPNHLALALNALERTLLLLDEINPVRGHRRRDPRVLEILEHISRHYARPLDVPCLAGMACLSPSRFAHLFRTQMGMGPMQYVEKYRLDRAAERLLGGNDSIEQIARSIGFDNPFHFSTRFRRRFGKAPSRYRINPGKQQ